MDSDNIKNALSYLQDSIKNKTIDSNKEKTAQAIKTIISDFDAIYKVLFIFGQKQCMNIIRISIYDYYLTNKFTYIWIDDTPMACFVPYLQEIYEKHGDKIFNKCRNGWKKMLIMFVYFQKYFNEQQFEIFIKRISKSQRKEYVKYCLAVFHYFPKIYRDKLKSIMMLQTISA